MESRMREIRTYGLTRGKSHHAPQKGERQVAPADALRPLPPRVGGREKGKVRNAETELTGEKRIV